LTRVASRLTTKKKSIRTRQVKQIQKKHEQHRNSFVAGVLQNQSRASARLEERLSKRKVNNKTLTEEKQTTVVVPVICHDKDYQKERKKIALRILQLRNNKHAKLVKCFQHLAPLDEAQVLHQQSLASVLIKLKVSDLLCERMAKDMVATKGLDLRITLDQFVSWAVEVVGDK